MASPDQLPLRDIHLPAPVSWWPPAPGWWLLAGLIVAAAAGLWFWRNRRRRRRLAAVTLAARELDAIRRDFDAGADASATLRRLSVLMRRLCISLFPRDTAAGITGEEWLRFLDTGLQQPDFSNGPGRVLQEGPYRPAVERREVEPLLPLCREWIEHVARTEGMR